MNSSLSRQCEGAGIGLYLVKSFAKIHGGGISVKNIKGKGCEFTITLPSELVKSEEYIEDIVLLDIHVERIEIEFLDIYSIQD